MKKLFFAGIFFAWFSQLVTAAPAVRDHIAYQAAGKTVTVWYYIPENATPTLPVVVVMPGLKRNGEDYLNDWIPHAKARNFLLVVPEFGLADFPGEEGYIYGNTVDKAGHPLPREQWSFSMIEPIFDLVRQKTGNTSAQYRLYGHSAGAQFVQRFIYFVPQARVARVVTANAGWYLLPEFTHGFPYGLKDTPVTDADLKHALALPLVVLLGEADTNAADKVLRHTPEADAQGLFRFARGKYFFARAEAIARADNIPFGWKLATAPGIGHSDAGMAPFALPSLLPE